METENKIFINRKFNCSAAQLFKWLVQPELVAKWFGPKELKVGAIESDLRVGGKFDIELIKPNNQHFFIGGEYLKINEPTKLSFTFQYKGLSTIPPDSIVEFRIHEVSALESELVLIQDFVSKPVDMENKTYNWEKMFRLLSELVNY